MSQHSGVPSKTFILWSIEILVNRYDFGNYKLKDISQVEREYLWPRFPSRILITGEYIKQGDSPNKVAATF